MKIKPGVIFGEEYNFLVESCKEKGYALPAVNVIGTNSINAVLAAARENRSDIIIQLSNSGAAFYAGKEFPNLREARLLGAVSAAQHIHLLAQYYGVCVVLHTDHANRSLLPWVYDLIEWGARYYSINKRPLFTSHMIDLSEEPLINNVDTCIKILKQLTPLHMSLEIELGVTGGEEDGIGNNEIDESRLYTNPEDVFYAYKELIPYGHFTIAASFGNVHGVYKPGRVQLRPKILKQSQEYVMKKLALNKKNPLHLVFHGGSGSEKHQIQESISYGVFKINIDTDTQFAFARPIGIYVQNNIHAFQHQVDPISGIPYKKIYDPRMFLYEGEKGIRLRLKELFYDFGSVNRSLSEKI